MEMVTDRSIETRQITKNRRMRTRRRVDLRREPREGVVAISGGVSIEAKQGIPIFVGVSAATCGSGGLAMQRVVIPPGEKCTAHLHIGSETALYVLQGHAETWYGEGLTQRAVTGPGDFLYIPPGVPHCARNLSDTEPVVAITARTDANDQERIQLYDVCPLWLSEAH